jgi:hypothetical protein
MFILNWTQIISNGITGAIQASFSAVAVYLAMKMINHAESGITKKAVKKEEVVEKKKGNQNGASLP